MPAKIEAHHDPSLDEEILGMSPRNNEQYINKTKLSRRFSYFRLKSTNINEKRKAISTWSPEKSNFAHFGWNI